jgi:hypothetical protein
MGKETGGRRGTKAKDGSGAEQEIGSKDRGKQKKTSDVRQKRNKRYRQERNRGATEKRRTIDKRGGTERNKRREIWGRRGTRGERRGTGEEQEMRGVRHY